mmetsp:Transcript_38949/g.128627  ORF Transcript_38949/g.128627 Transcript_38949/m.128627 type:complete len:255 (+) Transcript_38949:56-820(+)
MAQARLTIFFAAAVVLCSTAAFTPAPAHSGHAARAGLLRHSGLEQQYTSKLRQHTGAGWLQRVRRAAVCARGALSATAAATPAPAAPPRATDSGRATDPEEAEVAAKRAGGLRQILARATAPRGRFNAQAADPPVPPAGWLRSVDVMGRVFYVNTASRATAWEVPPSDPLLPSPASGGAAAQQAVGRQPRLKCSWQFEREQQARQLDAAQWREELRKRGAPDIYVAPPPPTAHGSADARKLLQLPPVASPDVGA